LAIRKEKLVTYDLIFICI